jgi:hypothetical protein
LNPEYPIFIKQNKTNYNYNYKTIKNNYM